MEAPTQMLFHRGNNLFRVIIFFMKMVVRMCGRPIKTPTKCLILIVTSVYNTFHHVHAIGKHMRVKDAVSPLNEVNLSLWLMCLMETVKCNVFDSIKISITIC